jgi:flagellar FliJ protein
MLAAPFRFRLERVRALRERKEYLAKRDLAQALDRLSHTEGELRAADARLAKAHDEHRSTATEGSVSGADLLAGQAFLERVEDQRRLGAREVRRRRGEVADRGVALGRAAQEHKMLERLKQRQRAQHLRELARREGAELDEIAIERFRRRAA